MSLKRALATSLCVAALTLPMLTAGCGDDAPPPPGSFAPLHYDYLTKLRLNVGSIDIQDHATPLGPDDISGQSPVTPAQALEAMAHERLFAAGLMGHADFVIDQASIVRGAGGALYGQMAVHLDISTAGGTHAGYAEARVARQRLPGSDSENLQTVLYGMTRDMMDSMNVELEYQIKRTMPDWLVTAAAVPAAVTAAPLGGAGGAVPPPASAPSASPVSPYAPLPAPSPYAPQALPPPSDTAVPPPTPSAIPQDGGGLPPSVPPQPDNGDAVPPPQQMSPPPGYLQLPSGTPQ